MRTTVALDATPLLGERSGVGNYTGRLLAAMLDAYPEWKYLLLSNRRLAELEPSLSRAEKIDSNLKRSRWLWMHVVVPRLIARHQPDLCHFTNALAPLSHQKPYVLSIHDASLFLYSRYHPRTRLLTVRLFLPLVARRAAAIITMSNNARDDLIKALRLPPEKIHVVYEAAPDNYAPLTDRDELAALRRNYKLPEQYLLYVGTLEPRKNLERLIHAFRELRGQGCKEQLVFAGPWGWSMDNFRYQIEQLGLSDSVRILGYVPAKDLPGLYSMASLFVFPSLHEGFGLPPLEAMACGAPVLCSNNSSLAEVCGNAAYMIDPWNQDDLADGIKKLLDSPEWRAELSRRGRQRAKSFSWRQAAVETMAIYRQVLAQY